MNLADIAVKTPKIKNKCATVKSIMDCGKEHATCKQAKSDMRFTYQILTNLSCNLDCDYCYERKNSWVNNLDDVKIFLSEMFERDKDSDLGRIVEFIGGEALMYPDFIEEIMLFTNDLRIKYDTCVFYSTCSNGTLFKTKKVKDFLEKYPQISCGISVDGPKELHDAHRFYAGSGKGSYDDIIGELEWYHNWNKTNGRKSSTKATFTLDNFKKWYFKAFKHCHELGFEEFAGNIIFEEIISLDDSLEIYNELTKCIDYLVDNKLEKVYNWAQLRIEFQEHLESMTFTRSLKEREGNFCGSGTWMTTLGTDGKIFGCNRFCTMGKDNMEIGKISNNTIIRYNEELFDELKEQYKLWPVECNNCTLKRSCPTCVAAPYETDDVQVYINEKRQCGWTHAMAMAKLYAKEKIKNRIERENSSL